MIGHKTGGYIFTMWTFFFMVDLHFCGGNFYVLLLEFHVYIATYVCHRKIVVKITGKSAILFSTMTTQAATIEKPLALGKFPALT